MLIDNNIKLQLFSTLSHYLIEILLQSLLYAQLIKRDFLPFSSTVERFCVSQMHSQLAVYDALHCNDVINFSP